jgi:epoxyqueuosine reductase QueG
MIGCLVAMCVKMFALGIVLANHTTNPYSKIKNGLLDWDKNHWQEITEETFKKVFSKSAVKRTKYNGLLRNVKFIGKE